MDSEKHWPGPKSQKNLTFYMLLKRKKYIYIYIEAWTGFGFFILNQLSSWLTANSQQPRVCFAWNFEYFNENTFRKIVQICRLFFRDTALLWKNSKMKENYGNTEQQGDLVPPEISVLEKAVPWRGPGRQTASEWQRGVLFHVNPNRTTCNGSLEYWVEENSEVERGPWLTSIIVNTASGRSVICLLPDRVQLPHYKEDRGPNPIQTKMPWFPV